MLAVSILSLKNRRRTFGAFTEMFISTFKAFVYNKTENKHKIKSFTILTEEDTVHSIPSYTH